MYQRFAAPKELHWIDAADHFFDGGLEELEERVRLAAETRLAIRPMDL
jgi:alpha/beta superfamily hydrolase